MASTSKYDFVQAYVGPHGLHLGCLTAFTRTREEAKRTDRTLNTGMRGRGTGSSPITKKRSRASIQRRIDAINAHCERHENDGVQAARVAKLTASLSSHAA